MGEFRGFASAHSFFLDSATIDSEDLKLLFERFTIKVKSCGALSTRLR